MGIYNFGYRLYLYNIVEDQTNQMKHWAIDKYDEPTNKWYG